VSEQELISNDIKPMKNEFGLPTGEFNGEYQEEVEEVQVAPEVIEQEVIEEPEVVVPEPEEKEEEEDLLTLAFSDDPVEEEEVSEESELDRLRTRLAQMEGSLEEQRKFFDNKIVNEPVQEPEPEEEEDYDFSNKEFRERIGEIVSEDPSTIPVIMQEMLDKKLAKYAKKMELLEQQAQASNKGAEQLNQMKATLYKGLTAAQALGDLEAKIVGQVEAAAKTGDLGKSVLLQYLSKNPHLAQTAEGIQDAVQLLARKAEIRAMKKGLDISSLTKQPASTRSNRMYEKQTTQTTEESDPDEEAFQRMRSSTRSSLSDLLNSR